METILTHTQIEFKNIQTLQTLLKTDNADILKLTSQAIAESGKNLENREHLSDKTVIESLLLKLSENEINACLVQICRALGNICYENDKARNIMNENGAVRIILTVLEKSLQYPDSTQLMKVTCGLLFNYLISNEEAQKEALKLDILPIVERVVAQKVEVFSTCEDLFIHILHVLSVLTEHLMDSWFSSDLLDHIVKILELSINPEISEICLELLHGQAENGELFFVYLRKKGWK